MNKCLLLSLCSCLKVQHRALKSCNLVADLFSVCIEARLFRFFTFLAQDVFQHRIKTKLRTACCINILLSYSNCMFAGSVPAGLLAQVGQAWAGLTLEWELNRPYICHWSRTEQQVSRAAGNPGSPRADSLLSWQEPHHLQVRTRRFQGKLPPLRASLKACIIKSRCYVFFVNGVCPNGMIQIQGIFGVLWSKDSWFILPSCTCLA